MQRSLVGRGSSALRMPKPVGNNISLTWFLQRKQSISLRRSSLKFRLSPEDFQDNCIATQLLSCCHTIENHEDDKQLRRVRMPACFCGLERLVWNGRHAKCQTSLRQYKLLLENYGKRKAFWQGQKH